MSHEPKQKKGFLTRNLLMAVTAVTIGMSTIAVPNDAQAGWLKDIVSDVAKGNTNKIISNIAGGAVNMADQQCKNTMGGNELGSSFCSEIKKETSRQGGEAVRKHKL